MVGGAQMVGRAHVGAAAAAHLGLLLVLLLALLWAEPSRAGKFGCGEREVGEAKRNPNQRGRPPLLVGDSTSLVSIPAVTRIGFDVNARGCRSFRDAIVIARNLRKRHRLPHLVVVNAYAQGGVTPDEIARALSIVGGRRVLGLVTAYNAETGAAPAPDTDVLAAAAEQFPTRILLLDWVQHSLPHHQVGDWFLPDLSHLNREGARAYARFLKRALPLAREGKLPPR
jgi:hypothetical protein